MKLLSITLACILRMMLFSTISLASDAEIDSRREVYENEIDPSEEENPLAYSQINYNYKNPLYKALHGFDKNSIPVNLIFQVEQTISNTDKKTYEISVPTAWKPTQEMSFASINGTSDLALGAILRAMCVSLDQTFIKTYAEIECAAVYLPPLETTLLEHFDIISLAPEHRNFLKTHAGKTYPGKDIFQQEAFTPSPLSSFAPETGQNFKVVSMFKDPQYITYLTRVLNAVFFQKKQLCSTKIFTTGILSMLGCETDGYNDLNIRECPKNLARIILPIIQVPPNTPLDPAEYVQKQASLHTKKNKKRKHRRRIVPTCSIAEQQGDIMQVDSLCPTVGYLPDTSPQESLEDFALRLGYTIKRQCRRITCEYITRAYAKRLSTISADMRIALAQEAVCEETTAHSSSATSPDDGMIEVDFRAHNRDVDRFALTQNRGTPPVSSFLLNKFIMHKNVNETVSSH